MRYLLDVNVLIALIDPVHIRHHDAHAWFSTTAGRSWATCPLTENGVLRIAGHTHYRNSPGSPAAVVGALRSLTRLPGHEFWPDDISLLQNKEVQTAYLSNAGQVTDTYLLALARAHGGRLATFDRSLVTNAVTGGKQTLYLID